VVSAARTQLPPAIAHVIAHINYEYHLDEYRLGE